MLNKHCFHKCFAYFGRFFLLIKNIYPAHIPAATSWHGLIYWTRQVGVDTKHFMRSVLSLSADIVHRCGLGFTQNTVSTFIVSMATKVWFTCYACTGVELINEPRCAANLNGLNFIFWLYNLPPVRVGVWNYLPQLSDLLDFWWTDY